MQMLFEGLITIDGHSGAGKTTLASAVSARLGIQWATQLQPKPTWSGASSGVCIKDTFYSLLWEVCRLNAPDEKVWLNRLHVFQSLMDTPTLSFYLKVPLHMSKERVVARESERYKHLDRTYLPDERADAIDNRFWCWLQEQCDHLHIIDATWSADVVSAEVLGLIYNELKVAM